MSHDFFPRVHSQNVFHCKTNFFRIYIYIIYIYTLIKWYSDSDLTPSPAIDITSCLLIACGTITCIHIYIYMQFPTIRRSQSPNFPLRSGREASRGGVHITCWDDLHFRWWVHQVGGAVESDRRGCRVWLKIWWRYYWVTWLGGGWRVLGGVFSIMRLNAVKLDFVAKYPSLVMVLFSDGLKPPTRLVGLKFL